MTCLEPLFFGEKLRRYDLMTALCVVAGLVLVTPNLDVSQHLTQGVLWGIVSGFTYALLALLNRSYVRTYPSITVTFYQQTFAALCILPMALRQQDVITGQHVALMLVSA